MYAKNAFVMVNRAKPVLYCNMSRQAFVLSECLTSAYYNKGSARGVHKDFDNLQR